MNALSTINESTITMSSLELVDFINSQEDRGDLTHANFMAKVPKVLGEGGLIHFQDTYRHLQNGQIYPCYRFPKREACLMAMSYSYDLQAKVFDRMTELEAKAAKPTFQLPDFSNPAAAARAWADAVEQKQALALENSQKQKLLEEAAPKVEFVDRYVDSTGLKGFRQVAKLLNFKEPEFREFLDKEKIMYRLGGEWMAFQHHIDAGRFEVRAGTSDVSGHAFNNCKFTPKGVAWIAGQMAIKKASLALASDQLPGGIAA